MRAVCTRIWVYPVCKLAVFKVADGSLCISCALKGLNGVATAVEFTLVPYGADFYDISIINGFNIGIEQLDSA